jgi:ketosteroid isomerase-like protein
MSQSNVELVRKLQPAPHTDLGQIMRDPRSDVWSRIANFFHSDFECVITLLDTDKVARTGIAGLRAAWEEWLQPWTTYRTEIEEVIDAGECIVVLTREYGRRVPNAPEVEMIAAAVWTVRESKIARVEFYPHRAEALKAVGRED